jgi:hypothetical protein
MLPATANASVAPVSRWSGLAAAVGSSGFAHINPFGAGYFNFGLRAKTIRAIVRTNREGFDVD